MTDASSCLDGRALAGAFAAPTPVVLLDEPNVIDQSAFSSFVRDNQIKQGTIVADKGFTIERLRTELEKNPDLHYLIPLKRNDRRIAAHDMTTFEGMLRGIDEQVLYKKVPLGNGRFLYSFRDRSRAAAEEAT